LRERWHTSNRVDWLHWFCSGFLARLGTINAGVNCAFRRTACAGLPPTPLWITALSFRTIPGFHSLVTRSSPVRHPFVTRSATGHDRVTIGWRAGQHRIRMAGGWSSTRGRIRQDPEHPTPAAGRDRAEEWWSMRGNTAARRWLTALEAGREHKDPRLASAARVQPLGIAGPKSTAE
jgi:hypothetical protein